METLRLLISPSGDQITHVHDDSLKGLDEALGLPETTRASHVDPIAGNRWKADMGPVGGPVLLGPDGKGFDTRWEALVAERAWLREHLRV